MNNDTMDIIFKTNSLKKKSEECDVMSLRMKVISCVCLLVDFFCAKQGDGIIVIITLGVLVIFFAIDVLFLKKKQQYEFEISQMTKKPQKIMNFKASEIHYPFVFYIITASVMVAWLINVCQ